VHVLAAPSSEPGTRPANTADTLVFAADALPLAPGDYVLLVTSAVYSVYQFFESVRVLGLRYGAGLEVADVPPALALSSQRPPAQAQEIRSCLRSPLALVRAAKGQDHGQPPAEERARDSPGGGTGWPGAPALPRTCPS
jgi:hypothetical protein